MRHCRPVLARLLSLLLIASPAAGAAELRRLSSADLDSLQPLSATRHAEILEQIGAAQVRYQLEDGPGGWRLHEGDLHVPGDLAGR